MHKLFQVPELTSITFRHLENDRPSLSTVAQCCRFFHNASAAIIWEKLDSILPLLRLFPSDAITLDKRGKTYHVVSTLPVLIECQ
jgi:hypothetical protein